MREDGMAAKLGRGMANKRGEEALPPHPRFSLGGKINNQSLAAVGEVGNAKEFECRERKKSEQDASGVF